MEMERIEKETKKLEATLKKTQRTITNKNGRLQNLSKDHSNFVKAKKQQPEYCYQAKIVSLARDLEDIKATMETFRAAVSN